MDQVSLVKADVRKNQWTEILHLRQKCMILQKNYGIMNLPLDKIRLKNLCCEILSIRWRCENELS